jgi:hypothetical protein
MNLPFLAAGLFVEAGVVGIVCGIFLILFIVAGIKQILSGERD